ncbi:zinc-dependent alcohol dehydrogenase family protein [Agromyces sp. NPDC058126]|uniref:zinc-dependent alcohol dehydrogenase family protein n=1 Tax=Agromyces sp. NPDC058126 TaxID=3346350 RepID=UPI0036D7970D
MRAVVYSAPTEFEVTDVPDPMPGPGEVRFRVELAGVCGTDLHVHDGTFFAEFPLTPGHEPVGVVDAIGEGVEGFELGRRIVATGVGGCGTCENCRRGKRLLCTSLTALGVTGPGAFAEYMIAPARWCFDAADLEPEQAVLAEPTACAIHGVERLALEPGSSALVIGAGPTGLILAQLLAHGNAATVTVAAPSAHKLALAARFGADEVVRIGRDGSGYDELRAIAPNGFDVVVDATGAAAVTQRALGHVRDGGTLLVYGVTDPTDTVEFSPFDVYRREISITGSFAQIDSFPAALAALRSGRVATDGLISHDFGLDEYDRALATLRDEPTAHKVVIRP